MKLRFFIYIFFIFFLNKNNYNNQNKANKINQKTLLIDINKNNNYQFEINNFIEKPYILKKIEFQSNKKIDLTELKTITALNSMQKIDAKILLNAIFYLKSKNNIEAITLKITKNNKKINCAFNLNIKQQFNKLTISGYLFGKEKYKKKYLLNPGEAFEQEKHSLSLAAINNKLKNLGFFSSKIKDTLSFDKNNNVNVALNISQGKRFKINNINFDLKNTNFIKYITFKKLEKNLKAIITKQFKSKYYSTKLEKKLKKKIKNFIKKNNLAYKKIEINKEINEKKLQVTLNIKIIFNTNINFVFFGNNFIKNNEINEALMLYDKSLTNLPDKIIIDTIKKLYYKKGFWTTSIKIEPKNNIKYLIINEGQRVIIKDVIFKSNEHFQQKKYIKFFKHLLKNKFFNQELYSKALKNLIHFYNSNSFLNFKIIKKDFIKIDDTNRYILKLNLDEGARTFIKKTIIPNYTKLEINVPYQIINSTKTIALTEKILTTQKNFLLKYFKTQNKKVFCEYELIEEKNKTNKSNFVIIKWNIKELENNAIFGKTILKGNTQIPYKKILNELDYKEKENYSNEKINNTIKNLKNLDLFEQIQIIPGEKNDLYNEIPIFLKLIDLDKYLLKTRLGIQQIGKSFALNNGITYKAGLTFNINNPLLIGDKFSLETNSTKFYTQFAAKYNFPLFFEKKIKSCIKIYNNIYNQPIYTGSNSTLFQSKQFGAYFSLAQTKNNFSYALNNGIECTKINNISKINLNEALDFESNLIKKFNNFFFIEPNLIYQNIDNLINPQNGILSLISIKAALGYKSNSSCKLLFENSIYKSILKNNVIAIRLRFGHIFSKNFTSISPLERFYLGGVNTVRGFYKDYCAPLGKINYTNSLIKNKTDLSWNYIPQGGKTMLNCNLELRMPCYKELNISIFNDLGILSKNNLNSIWLSNTYGFGLRYNTAIGPIRFDIGWKSKKNITNFEPAYIWYLTLGNSF